MKDREENINMEKKVKVICPTCKKSDNLNVPAKIIQESKQLTTVSIPKGLICDHNFQAFIDKNLVVRGYQMSDYDFSETEFFNETTPSLPA